ncbi:LarC family nickel insertion protein [Gemmatimonadota bacterium]
MALRTLYLESVAGIAGDMFSAAFVDAGLVDPEDLRAVPGLLGFSGVEVELTNVERAGARSTHLRVVVPEKATGGRGTEGGHLVSENRAGHSGHGHGGHAHQHHHYPALVRRIEGSGLAPEARTFALRVFGLLAEAEADAHGVSLEKVVFHEVGAVDSLVDVVMAGVCVHSLAPDRVLASPVKLGRGTIQIEHGTHPVPPPASARLAVGMPVATVPEAITRPDVELSTPTGLAILRALEPAFVEGWPEGTLKAQGSGSGSLDLGEYPNVFRVALVEEGLPGGIEGGELPFDADQVVEIRCNVDDQTGERTAWVVERALAEGALDAWLEPIVGKKGRPAVCIVLLAKPQDTSRLADFLLRRSSTFGVRYSAWNRLKLVREFETRDTPGGPVSFKVGKTTQGDVVKEKPEYEDLKKIWEADPDFGA